MTVLALDMPEERAQLAGWLERQLVSLELAQLVAELAVLQPPPASPAVSLADLLGEWLEPVLAGGLRLVPEDVLRRLLNHPGLLLDLQEDICHRGGRFWDSPSNQPRLLGQMVERSRQELADILPGQDRGSRIEDRGSRIEDRHSRSSILDPRSSLGQPTGLLLAGVLLAAALVAAAILVSWLRSRLPEPESPIWGWNRPGVLTPATAPGLYYQQLADRLSEWYDKRPDDPAGLEARLLQLRQGCTALAQIEPGTLPPEDGHWLRQHGQAWSAQLEPYLGALKREPVGKVRDNLDLAVGRIIRSLHEREQERAQAP